MPDDDDDDPVRLITDPDGTPRTVRIRRSTGLRLAPLTGEQALAIVTWRYPPPYDCYDMTGAGPDELLTPGAGYFAVLAGGRLVGFWAFGDDGRVPGGEYDDSALDIGGGLRPELVGRGLGREVVAAGLAHGRELFAPIAFRVTVASFNERALRTVEAAGFRRVDRFVAPTGRSFEVLVRAERSAGVSRRPGRRGRRGRPRRPGSPRAPRRRPPAGRTRPPPAGRACRRGPSGP